MNFSSSECVVLTQRNISTYLPSLYQPFTRLFQACRFSAPSVWNSLPQFTFWLKWINQFSFISHSRTVVRECRKGDDASQWENWKFDPLPRPYPLTDRHQRLHVIRSRMSVHMQNLVVIPYAQNWASKMFTQLLFGGSSGALQPIGPWTDFHA